MCVCVYIYIYIHIHAYSIYMYICAYIVYTRRYITYAHHMK